ncbi:alpha/beta hydrolase [Kribbella sp. NPDC026611]|uniref:alpha/beta hydrolase n=1 Tax=Kribbella sp. NPDC026611 TaxID=3154911 RepID=UPI0033C4079F
MGAKTVNKLAVPGATLHYEVTGSGPMLLLIAGGGTDAGVFDGIVGPLAADYTVVTYDPRGNSRSPYVGAPADERVDQAADDALALIDVVSPHEPAYVLGSSSGAITGLELITRYPDRVRMLVAHEPPCTEVLPDAADARAFFQEVYDTYLKEGVAAADAVFMTGIGAHDDSMPQLEDLLPEYREPAERMQANAPIFYAHKLLPFTRYQPDLEALKKVADRIVPAAGTDSLDNLPGRPIQYLSAELGWPVVTFPGGHGGYASHPAPFATHLHQVLSAPSL